MHYSNYRNQFKRAALTAFGGGVKRHVFVPSGRALYTVVGRRGDEFLDPDGPYCSCEHFFYRVMGGREQSCYHLLSYRIARESKRIDEVLFNDEEYYTFLSLLTLDLMSRDGDKHDKEMQGRPATRPR